MKSKNLYLRYSEAFKSQVLSEIEAGELTIADARRKYAINGVHTIPNWARKSGRFGIVSKLIKVESPKERNQTKALKEENRRLKETIADLVLDRKIAESTLEVICEQQGWDIEEIKKKAGILLQQKSQRKEKK
jgi:transposase-like protein